MNKLDPIAIFFLALVLFVVGVLSMTTYSDYSICKTYFSELNPLVCMFSSKIKVVTQ
jgi:hypothetical protein